MQHETSHGDHQLDDGKKTPIFTILSPHSQASFSMVQISLSLFLATKGLRQEGSHIAFPMQTFGSTSVPGLQAFPALNYGTIWIKDGLTASLNLAHGFWLGC